MIKRYEYLLVLILVPACALAAVITVPDDFPTIQEAIDAASPGDTVEVLPGTYQECIDFLGKDILVIGTGGPDSTVIDADGQDRPVTFQSGEGPNAVLTGFMLINGNGWTGGGVLISNGSSPVISNCVITECFGYMLGGAIAIDNSSPVIIGNVLEDNYAFSGPSGLGGAICMTQSSAVICGNLITNNDAELGSALYLNSDSSIITNNLIAGNPNTYFYPQGTIHCTSSCQTTFHNNTVADNEVEAFWGSGSQMDISNCIIWGNGPVQIQGSFNITYSDVQYGYLGLGNINDTPCFISGSLSDYHLDPDSSSCIDAGNPAPEYNDSEDPANPGFALWPALGELRNDMGVYGGSGAGYWVGIEEESMQLEEYSVLISLFPNPFSSILNIIYSIPEPAQIELKVYDLSGRLCGALESGRTATGIHTTTWNPDPALPNGCYLIVLEISGARAVRRTVLLR